MEFDANLPVSQKSIDAATNFGVELDESRILSEEFTTKFLRRLLLKKNVLQDVEVKPEVVKRWQEILSCLEGGKRKLLDVQGDNLNFVLFCPSHDSLQQLEDETWKEEIMTKTNDLLKELGM